MTLVAAVAIVWYLGHLSAMDVAITAAVVRAIAAMNAVNIIWSAIGTTGSQIGALKGAANHGGIKRHPCMDWDKMHKTKSPKAKAKLVLRLRGS